MRRLLLAALALAALATPAAGYSNGYSFSRAITVAGSVVPSTQVNFPMLVTGTYSYLATFPNQGMVHNTVTLNSQTVPADLIFTSDAAGTIPLKWEIASYTAATGAIEAWVQIPSLSNGTVIYMFYDNVSVTTYQGSATSAWGGNYGAVWHLTGLLDSSGNSNTLTSQGHTSATTGVIGGAYAFSGATPSGLDASASSSFNNLAALTYSLWVKPAALTSTGALIYGGVSFYINATSGTISVQIPTSSIYRSATCSTGLSLNSWSYVALTYTTGTAPKIYINGSQCAYSAQAAGSGTDNSQTGDPVGVGGLGSNPYAYALNGIADEARIAQFAASANWIATEYNNQNSPASFYTVGSAVSIGSAAGTTSTAIII